MPEEDTARQSRLIALFVLILLAGCASTRSTTRHLQNMTAMELALAIRQGQLTSTEVLDDYIARIEAQNVAGTALNAVIMLDRTAHEQADRLDRLLASGELAGRRLAGALLVDRR